MRLIDIANRIDKSKENEDWVDIEELGNEFDVDVPYTEQNRIKCYWIGNWYCTDSYVGYRMYFLDDEPVAFSTQLGRKSDENFKWFNIESAKKVREYLISLINPVNEELNLAVWDINEEVGESFKIEFNAQILSKDRIKLNGEKVEILERIKNKPYGIDTELKIKLQNGDEKHVDIRDLDFGYHVM
jgi:hypothetical protein